ncbi:hypothetical protein ES703_66031 [subsurface metagenome]
MVTPQMITLTSRPGRALEKSLDPAWEDLLRKPDYGGSKGKFNVYWGIESPISSSENDRIIWILSSEKKE